MLWQSSGGPPLIFDHQMAMDCEAQILYVFGGRVLDGDWDTSKYSGLYSYNVRLSRWRLLQLVDCLLTMALSLTHSLFYRQSEASSTQGYPVIPPRFGEYSLDISHSRHSSPRERNFTGHSMVLDSTSKVLYIFAGQREDRYLSDMYAYDIKTGIAKEIFSNFSSAGGPDACFTQRAVIDPNLKELYVLVTFFIYLQRGLCSLLHYLEILASVD